MASLRKTSSIIFIILLDIFLCLFFIEIGLRVRGYIFLSLQDQKNKAAIMQKGGYRVMCLGESTTANQYPYFLEEILNQRKTGIKFEVIDKGMPAASTSAILNRLEDFLNEYRPDMVITMMGASDSGERVFNGEIPSSKMISFVRSLKIYKLIRFFESQGVSKRFQAEPTEIQVKRIFTEDAFNKAIELNPKNDNAYVELGGFYRSQGKLSRAEDSFKKAVELNPKNDKACAELGRLYRSQNKFSQAEGLFKKAIELNPENEIAYGELATLYDEMGKNNLFDAYAQEVNRLRLRYYNPATVNNYHKLKEILDKRGIRLVCVQYPLRNVEPLKKIFEKDEGVIFVDNESVFREALKKASYREYFRDMLGGDFGHCTEKGNRLLAQNIANVILKELFSR